MALEEQLRRELPDGLQGPAVGAGVHVDRGQDDVAVPTARSVALQRVSPDEYAARGVEEADVPGGVPRQRDDEPAPSRSASVRRRCMMSA